MRAESEARNANRAAKLVAPDKLSEIADRQSVSARRMAEIVIEKRKLPPRS